MGLDVYRAAQVRKRRGDCLYHRRGYGAGYTAEISGPNITNRYTPELISVSVSKVWEDANDRRLRPEEITERTSGGWRG